MEQHMISRTLAALFVLAAILAPALTACADNALLSGEICAEEDCIFDWHTGE